MPKYRLDVANRETGAEDTIELVADSEAQAEARAGELGFVVRVRASGADLPARKRAWVVVSIALVVLAIAVWWVVAGRSVTIEGEMYLVMRSGENHSMRGAEVMLLPPTPRIRDIVITIRVLERAAGSNHPQIELMARRHLPTRMANDLLAGRDLAEWEPRLDEPARGPRLLWSELYDRMRPHAYAPADHKATMRGVGLAAMRAAAIATTTCDIEGRFELHDISRGHDSEWEWAEYALCGVCTHNNTLILWEIPYHGSPEPVVMSNDNITTAW